MKELIYVVIAIMVIRFILKLFRKTAMVKDFSDDADLLPEASIIYSGLSIPLKIKYLDGNDEKTIRKIELRAITEQGRSRYFKAYCHLRKEMRTFRVDRIKGMIDLNTGEIFRTMKDFYKRYTPSLTE